MIATVVVGTDGSETAHKAVLAALDLAERFEARIVFVSAYTPVDPQRLRREKRDAPADIQWSINPQEDVEGWLGEAEELAKERGIRCSSEASKGEPADVLVRLAEKYEADVLVIGNKGMHRKVLGSVPNTVSHKADCSVLIVKTT